MALLSNSKTVSIDAGVMAFAAGNYTLDFTTNKNFIQIKAENGQTTNLRPGEFDNVETIVIGQDTTVSIDFNQLNGIGLDFRGNGGVNLTGIAFTEANEALDSKFEPNANETDLDAAVSELIQERGVTGAIEALTINGTKADAFKVIWDHLDDNYSYYNTAVNDAFIDLGIAYANYLLEGGTPLTDVVVKYAADSTDDVDTTPERLQSLHDNILGNFDEASITDKFGAAGDDAIFLRIQDAGLGDLIGNVGDLTDGRGIYGGYDNQDPTQQRTFDADFFGILI